MGPRPWKHAVSSPCADASKPSPDTEMSQAWHPLISQPSNKDEMRWKTMKLNWRSVEEIGWRWRSLNDFKCFFEAKLILFLKSPFGNNRLGILPKIWILHSSYRLDSLETWHVVDIVWMFPSVLLSHKSYHEPFCMNPASWFTLIYPVCSSVNSASAYHFTSFTRDSAAIHHGWSSLCWDTPKDHSVGWLQYISCILYIYIPLWFIQSYEIHINICFLFRPDLSPDIQQTFTRSSW